MHSDILVFAFSLYALQQSSRRSSWFYWLIASHFETRVWAGTQTGRCGFRFTFAGVRHSLGASSHGSCGCVHSHDVRAHFNWFRHAIHDPHASYRHLRCIPDPVYVYLHGRYLGFNFLAEHGNGRWSIADQQPLPC